VALSFFRIGPPSPAAAGRGFERTCYRRHVGGRRCAIATLCAALASSSGCLSDLTKPPGLDGGGEGEDGGGGEPDAGGGGPRCDPALPFGEPVLLTTAPSSINTTWEDGWPRVSRDDLTLYWVRAQERDGGRFLGGNLFFRRQPGHIADSKNDLGATIRFTLGF